MRRLIGLRCLRGCRSCCSGRGWSFTARSSGSWAHRGCLRRSRSGSHNQAFRGSSCTQHGVRSVLLAVAVRYHTQQQQQLPERPTNSVVTSFTWDDELTEEASSVALVGAVVGLLVGARVRGATYAGNTNVIFRIIGCGVISVTFVTAEALVRLASVALALPLPPVARAATRMFGCCTLSTRLVLDAWEPFCNVESSYVTSS